MANELPQRSPKPPKALFSKFIRVFDLIMQKTIILSISSKSDPIFQDLKIFVKATKPKTYFEAMVRLRL